MSTTVTTTVFIIALLVNQFHAGMEAIPRTASYTCPATGPAPAIGQALLAL
ncbi:hypothetical protein [Salinispora mooreana]|uniref:hypothetical protein n=1 Tax=Salinispora mooreana TaxID=999545 RepID=UPI001CC5241C|nr:hypothetical protein [Salinispora mooreana]